MTQNILLHGNSIFLVGLAAWLQTQPGLTVRRQLPGDALLPADASDVVIVDIHETPVREAMALAPNHSQLTVIGVDAQLGTATVLSEQIHPARSMNDLLNYLK